MSFSRVLSRLSRTATRSSVLLSSPAEKHHVLVLSNQFHNLVFDSQKKLVARQMSMLNHSALDFSTFQRFGISSSAAPGAADSEHGSTVASEDSKVSGHQEDLKSGEAKVPDKKDTSDSEGEVDLSNDDWVKLVSEKDELLKAKDKEIEIMKDKFLRICADMENDKDRAKREAEKSIKFAIQSFAKGVIDVADNLGRASSVVKESFSKIDSSQDGNGSAPLLKTLLEGVEMTEKQVAEVLKKFNVEKFDPINEPFDPHRHNAIFQMPDASKPPGTVAVVLKSGYMLHDRVIRPAEVGVTQAAEDGGSEA